MSRAIRFAVLLVSIATFRCDKPSNSNAAYNAEQKAIDDCIAMIYDEAQKSTNNEKTPAMLCGRPTWRSRRDG